MIMTERLEKIYEQLAKCKKFADVGCDHGYIAEAMLESGRAERVVVSDISAPSLNKAVRLLERFTGKFSAVVCDGLKLVDADCDQVLIAGMGGEEIISILKNSPFLPERLVLQPMKNQDKVRFSLLSLGYRIQRDTLFKAEGRFYNLISASKGEDSYTEAQLFFGRDNLKERQPDFIEYVRLQYQKYTRLLEGDMPDGARDQLELLKNKYGGIIDEIQ